MSQQNKSLRLPIAMTIAAVIAVGVFAWHYRRQDLKPVVNKPAATAPATQPATQPLVKVEPPPRDYFELLHREFPKLATTQPIDQPLNMRDWGHFLINHPIYIDRRGGLWITHPQAQETAALLTSTAGKQVYLTRERVVYAHWFFNEGGDWTVMLVVPSSHGGFDIVSAKERTAIGKGDDYDWSRAFSLPAEKKIIVPRDGRVSVFTTDQNISESISPVLAEGGTVQIQPDFRGFLAWVPPEEGHVGSKGVVRYVEGNWVTLGPDQGWPANLLYLVLLDDGTVLQIIADEGGKVRLAYAALDAKQIDEQRVTRLIIELSDTDAQKREKAFAELSKFGPGLWPIAEKMMDTALPDAQERLKSLLKSKLTPLLGTMQLPEDARLRVVSRFAEGGALFYADNGVLIPHGDVDVQVVKPAWIVHRQGYAVQQLDPDITQSVDPARAQLTISGNEWLITDNAMGPQRLFAGALVPLLRRNERQYSELVGIDARGRYLFREPVKMDRPAPATRPTTTPTSQAAMPIDSPTLVIDPTLPDPLPRLPVWHVTVRQGSVGWTADGWPVMKSVGAWALGTRDWRSMDDKIEKMLSSPEDVPPPPEFKPELPATLPSTNPTTHPATAPVLVSAGEKPLLQDPDGNWYFDGKTALKVISKTGKVTTWPLPGTAAGDAEPWLVRTQEGLLFLFNQPGRLLRIRPTPDKAEPFELEATFSRNIPNEAITRMWLDPAGRIVIAWAGNELAILFPLGFIPPATDRIIPANEQGIAGDE